MTFRDAIAASPSLFPLAWDERVQSVQMVRLTEADYAAASFLDARLLNSDMRVAWVPWRELEPAAAGLPMRCDFIFHVSHCGSTLLSRLLGTHPAVFSLREPQILRQPVIEHLDTFLGLWSRTFHPGQRALIKATSFVSERAEDLLARVPDSRALLMFISVRTFLAALLDGAMSDIESQTASRWERLQRRLNHAALPPASPGEVVAMSWLCEMLALSAAAERFHDRTHWIDFDSFLATPAAGLIRGVEHLRNAAPPSLVEEVLAGPLMQRYAKKLEAGYDAALRRKLLQQAEAKHGSEIQQGLLWLSRLAETDRSRLPAEAMR